MNECLSTQDMLRGYKTEDFPSRLVYPASTGLKYRGNLLRQRIDGWITDSEAAEGAPVMFPPDVDEGIVAQRQMIASMQKPGPGVFCCNDPATGRPLTFGQVFDRHAQAMLVIAEVEARCAKG